MKFKKLIFLHAITLSASILSGCALLPTVTWLDWDGEILERDRNVFFGSVPTYDKSNPTRPSTDEFDYKFVGWDKEVTKAWLLHIEYKAVYEEIRRSYKVTWQDSEFGQLKEEMVPYGSTPQAWTPTHDADAKYTYEFVGWDKEPTPVTGEVTYTTTFAKHIRSYEIKFVGFNNTLLKSEVVEYGKTPTPPESIPVSVDDQNVYTFKEWDKEISLVTGTTTYNVVYSSRTREHLDITYVIDGVKQDAGIYKDSILEYSILSLPSYTPTDYYDVEWYLTKEYDASSLITDNVVTLEDQPITLYGKRIGEHKFNITYNLGDGGSFPTDKYPSTVTYYEVIDLNELEANFDVDAPRLKEHMFDGWVNEKGDKVESLSNVTEDVVLKATYKVQKYNIYFDYPPLAAISFEVTYNSEDYLEELSKDIYTATRFDDIFLGWSFDHETVVSGPYLYSKDMALFPLFKSSK